MLQRFLMLTILLLPAGFTQNPGWTRETPPDSAKSSQWRGLHVIQYKTDADLDLLARQIPDLAAIGLNVLIVEVNYSFDFRSHPELREGKNVITRRGAGRVASVCKKHGIRLIPEFQSLGHQSWKNHTLPLLAVYPQFDLTPGAFPENKSIYCREWDPMNPEVTKVVFALMDEIIDAFEADAVHVGLDEVFLIGRPESPSTKGMDPAKVFAKAVNDLHQHLVQERKLKMLMWADRLIDARKYHWSRWEASDVGTAPALDLIPKDIILCPWHYEPKKEYPSIPLFLEKRFQILPASWRNVDASKSLIQYSRQFKSANMLGHIFTTWGGRKNTLAQYPPLVAGLKLLQN